MMDRQRTSPSTSCTMMKHQHGEPPKEEEDGLILGDAKAPASSHAAAPAIPGQRISATDSHMPRRQLQL
jgi:hypothetical protein